jgi:squalene-hopene/tetraprenyl-beta-curcumene cyclase
VPDADDTPGAILALLALSTERAAELDSALSSAIGWLLDLQNRDGGWPTFCRGWGALPFDRSAPDITAHALRALTAWRRRNEAILNAKAVNRSLPDAVIDGAAKTKAERLIENGLLINRVELAVTRGFRYLEKAQRPDGSWLPLWFGNQFGQNDENPTYGTARVLAAYRDADRFDAPAAGRGIDWLCTNQNEDGGWGATVGLASSNEETALAVDALLAVRPESVPAQLGVTWLLDSVESGRFREPAPIGFYFAKLWYFENLYPLAFIVAALRRAKQLYSPAGRIFHPSEQSIDSRERTEASSRVAGG